MVKSTWLAAANAISYPIGLVCPIIEGGEGVSVVALALEWVDWFNHRRLFEAH